MQNKNKSIKQWNDDEKPRERLALHGASSLSDSELIAILLGGGTAGRTAIDLARELLSKYSNLSELAKSDFSKFKLINGIGPAKAITLAAAFELSKRVNFTPINNGKTFKNTIDLAEYYIPKLRNEAKEKLILLLMTPKMQIFREEVVSIGVLDSVLIHPREVFSLAIAEKAHSIVVLHNHPSGNPTPSYQDREITKKLVKAGNIISIPLKDHIIIAGDSYFSFVKEGLI